MIGNAACWHPGLAWHCSQYTAYTEESRSFTEIWYSCESAKIHVFVLYEWDEDELTSLVLNISRDLLAQFTIRLYSCLSVERSPHSKPMTVLASTGLNDLSQTFVRGPRAKKKKIIAKIFWPPSDLKKIQGPLFSMKIMVQPWDYYNRLRFNAIEKHVNSLLENL